LPRRSDGYGKWRSDHEAAEHNPSIDTLVELSRKLGLKMRIEVTPDPGVSVKVTKVRAA